MNHSIGSTFLHYFQKEGHTRVDPSSLIPPHEDKSILFTNSGMNQFKPILIGTQEPSVTYACNNQICARLGGKHNDLDDVGRDVYHHTLFYMLGNWSFKVGGQSTDETKIKNKKSNFLYKEEAIYRAWTLLTKEYKLDPSRLYVTYFGGGNFLDQDGNKVVITADEDTKQIWSKFIDEKRILPFGVKDNFWEMGSTGPCGCSTEIHYDLKGDRDGSLFVNQGDPTLVELWNLVFISYNRQENNSLVELKACSVDTGMGLERLVMVLQNKMSTYETDLFQPLMAFIYQETKVVSSTSPQTEMAYRVVADHLRAMIFMLKDDIVPYSEGRGVMWTKLLKRACSHLYVILGGRHMVLSSLAKQFCSFFSSTQPYGPDEQLRKMQNIIHYVIATEEKQQHIIWKTAITFQKLLQKQPKTITKQEYTNLTKTRGVSADVVDQFVLDFKISKE
jgi:alanyl-tRNA synthetase